MASKLDNHITLADHGPIRVREKGFAVANVASLGRCAVENRGAQYRVEGGAGVADVTYECMKDSADAYAWEIVTGGGGAFVEKTGDTMTGDLAIESASADLTFIETGAAADRGRWRFSADANVFRFLTGTDAGAYTEAMRFTSAAGVPSLLTINEAAQDMDVRVEGTTDANLLRTDAGNNRVGIGTATPAATLDVNGEIRGTSLVNATHDHTNAAGGGVLGPAALGVIGIYQDSDYTGSNSSSAQKVFNESANGAATVAASTTYEMDAIYRIETTGSTSHALSLGFAGTATLTSIGYEVSTPLTPPATDIVAASYTRFTDTAAQTAVSNAVATATLHTVRLKGLVRVNAGGTFIPQFKWSAAPGGTTTVKANSFLTLTPIGNDTVTTIGGWS